MAEFCRSFGGGIPQLYFPGLARIAGAPPLLDPRLIRLNAWRMPSGG
jgi:hypothetical protein